MLPIGGGNNHTISIVDEPNFASLRVWKSENEFTSLVFYDTGKVAIERYANGWKATATLRDAD